MLKGNNSHMGRCTNFPCTTSTDGVEEWSEICFNWSEYVLNLILSFGLFFFRDAGYMKSSHRSSFSGLITSVSLMMTLHLVTAVFASAEDERERIIEVSEEAREIHFSGLLFDGHNDLPWQLREVANSSFDVMDISQHQPKLHTDIPRLRAGGLKAQFWSVYVPASTDVTGDALLQTMNQINIVKQMHRKYPNTFEMANTADDVERIVADGKIASMMGIEGGHSIQGEIGNLKRLYDEGCRYMTLTHSKSLSWADAATDDSRVNGLSDFGREVIQEMNRLGMLVDISHVSPATMKQALAASRAPVIFSHSSALSINDHPRNVPDDVLRLTAENGGVVMVNFYSEFVAPTELVRKDKEVRGTIYDVVDHIEHIIKTAGIDHVGIGSDFDGVPRLPTQLDDVSSYPKITQELLTRGYRRDDIHKLLGGNVLRALRTAERVSKEMNTNVSGCIVD